MREEKSNVKNSIFNAGYPWFIKIYKGIPIITIIDLNELLGFEVELRELIRSKRIINYIDYNGLGKGKLREEFEKLNKVKYREETVTYLYITGFLKVCKILMEEEKISLYELQNVINLIDNNEIKYLY